MKILNFLFISALFCTFSAHGASLSQIKKSGVLRIATEGSFAPFNYYQGGQLTGFEVELGNEIAKSLKLKPEWQTMQFGILFNGLDQDRYDLVISSHAVTLDREKEVLFASPHYCSGGVIVSKQNGPQTKAALAGKIVGAQSTSIYPKFLESIQGIKTVKTFQKDEDSLHALIADRVDAIVLDKFMARELEKKNNTPLQISAVINPEKNAMAMAKGNVELKDAVEKAIKELMKNGTYEKLSKKYFSEDIRCK